MRVIFFKEIIFMISSLLLLASCSQKNNNFDIDLSNLPRPKKIVNKTNNTNNNTTKPDYKLYISDLVLLKNKDQILSKFEYGRKDPFSKNEITINRLFSELKLLGILNADSKKYILVSYLDKQGTITENSIGGKNTNLLPLGAKVIDIDYENMKVIINFENKDYIFEF